MEYLSTFILLMILIYLYEKKELLTKISKALEKWADNTLKEENNLIIENLEKRVKTLEEKLKEEHK